MPELPEVETIRRDLEPRLVGRTIAAVVVAPDTGKPVPVIKGMDETTFREGVVGSRIDAVDRRGKYLIFRLDSGLMLVVHLRMTGALLHRQTGSEPDRFLRATLVFDDANELRFTDIRKFGGLWLADDMSQVTTDLGPEPLGEGFTLDSLVNALTGRKAPIKSIILDQRRIAGIGNIYADEACFQAALEPRRLGMTLSEAEISRLHVAIRSVLQTGVESRGASFRDYKDADGKQGSMHMYVKVFRRTGQPCYTCGTEIQRVVVGGRSTHFCPTCQN
jgi:formamidopyrimidine-DNA glycosylase